MRQEAARRANGVTGMLFARRERNIRRAASETYLWAPEFISGPTLYGSQMEFVDVIDVANINSGNDADRVYDTLSEIK